MLLLAWSLVALLTPPAAPDPPHAGVRMGVGAQASASQTAPSADAPALLAQLRATQEELGSLLASGQLPSMPRTAFLARDAALTLEDRLAGRTGAAAVRARDAIRAIVLAAWRMEAASDAGDLMQVTHAYERLSAAVRRLADAYPRP